MKTSILAHTQHSKQRMSQRGIDAQCLEAVTLYGDRFVLDDGTLIHLVTRKAADRLVRETGRSPAQVDDQLKGLYVVISRDGAIITCGRRWGGRQGRMRRS